jgi:hypothetical protein
MLHSWPVLKPLKRENTMWKATVLLACFVVVGTCLAPAATAQEVGPVPSGVWRLELDEELDGRVRGNAQTGVIRLRVIHNRIFGQPADDDPDRARLTGEIVPSRAPVVTWRQDNANIEGSSTFCTGRVVRGGVIVGTWYDTQGKAGDFVLTFVQR